MALTKFVRNVQDLSDDGGYKFRFKCDGCSDGYESQYIGSSANLIKTAVDVFSMFRVFGAGSRRVANGIDRGLRGKERDAAYEQAVSQAMAHFKKCAACGRWVCPEHCWNDGASMCERCAPDAVEAGAKRAAQRRAEQAETEAGAGAVPTKLVTCPACGVQARGAKFCEGCGASFSAPACRHCQQPISQSARFCGSCGGAQA